jgi:hypothetical protein
MTAIEGRMVACRMRIEPESQEHLRKFSFAKSEALKRANELRLENPSRQKLALSWNEEKRVWESGFFYPKIPPNRF